MKRVPLKNITSERLLFPDIRNFDFDIEEVKRVLPAMLEHPSVKRRMGTALKVVSEQAEEEAPKVVKPTAPESPPSKPAVAPPPADEPTAAVEEPAGSEPEDETAGESLREAFLAGPGITDSNVDAIMDKYPTLEELSGASKSDLVELGVAKSFAKKLRYWASN